MLAILIIYVAVAMVFVPALVGACASTFRRSVSWAALVSAFLFIGWDLSIGPDLHDRYGVLSEKTGLIAKTWIINCLKAGVTGAVLGAAGYATRKGIAAFKRRVDEMTA